MPTEIRSEEVRANGIRLHLLRAGAGQPLLLLHGWPEFAGAWRRLMPRLADRFEVIAPDFRGFGLSENPHPGPHPVTAEMLAEDSLALLDALGLERVGIVSHDIGSNVAQEMARRAPGRVRGLFFFSVTYPGIGARWLVTCAPTSLRSKVESWVAVTPIVTVFLSSVERRFSVPAARVHAVAHSLGQGWPKATGAAGAQRP